ncbi:MAG: DUF4180 domain-containing protein [Spirochaetaceae bacterium]|nr:DUF4180 domain-containing protein [Spirochaetaceae bacterium]
MTSEVIQTEKGALSRCRFEAEAAVASLPDFLDLLGNCPTETLVLDREALHPDFFELRSGLAGELLQKVSNYRRRLVILGDFTDLPGKALRDFLYESNRTGKVVFARELGDAVGLLR